MLHGPVSPKFIVSRGLSLLHPGPAIFCSTSLHGSRYIRRGPPEPHQAFCSAHRGLVPGVSSLLWETWQDSLGVIWWPLRQLDPHQVGTFVELALPSYHSMIVAAPLYPPHEVTEPFQLDAGGSMELPFHIGHILEGVIFLNAPPLIQALEKMFKDLISQLILFHLLEGGKIVLIIGPEDMFKVLPPPLAPIIDNILQSIFRSPRAATTLVRGASRC